MYKTQDTSKPNKEDNVEKSEDLREKDAALEPNSDPDFILGTHKSVLEAFEKYNWYNTISPQKRKSLREHFKLPEDSTESHAIKLVQSKLVAFSTREYRCPPLLEHQELPFIHLPGLQPNHQSFFPKRSVLDRTEQTKLYQYYCRLTLKNRRPLKQEELSEFQTLRAKAAGEYSEFQEIAKSEWYKVQWKRTLQIPLDIELYISCLWKTRSGECLASYPYEYQSIAQVPLSLNDPNLDFSVMEFVKDVRTRGIPMKMSLPNLKKPVELITGFEELSKIKPVSDFPNQSKPFTQRISAVSFDDNVEDLLKQGDLDIDVAISMSGIKTLVDNIKFQREWILPVTVKNVIKSDGKTLKKVVLIDKNLHPKSLSVHEKNLWHAKIVAKWMLILNDNPHLFNKQLDKPLSETKGSCESYDDLLNDAVEKLKVVKSSQKVEEITNQSSESPQSLFNRQQTKTEPMQVKHGGNASSQQPKTEPMQVKHGGNASSQQTKTEPMKVKHGGNASSQQTKTEPMQVKHGGNATSFKPHKKSSQQNVPESRKLGRENLVSYDDPFSNCVVEDVEEFGVNPSYPKIIPTQHTKQEKRAWNEMSFETSNVDKSFEGKTNTGNIRKTIPEEVGASSNRKFLKPSARRMNKPCLQYQLWNIHKSKYNQFLKIEQRTLNVLVRTRKDGKLFHYENGTSSLDDVCVSSKLEFQPEFGATKMAASELIREYVDLYMRPKSKLVRVRSVGHTKEVMLTELKTLSEVREALQMEVQKMQKLFDSLYVVLTKLIDLNPGRYMLQHKAKDGPFATLLKENPGWTSFNLLYYCSELVKEEVSVPPMPIDPLVITALHHRDRVAPALFSPCFQDNGISRGYFRKPNPDIPSKTVRRRNKRKRQKMKKASLSSNSPSNSVK